MDTLQVLVLLQLLVLPASSLPHSDYWGEFGSYGPCSRTCGTGVSLRTRTCITSRTDGKHNCIGSARSFRTCNTQECPAGSKDFRAEQCSQFDGVHIQSKRHNWVPYYGGSNPCELSCVPRGENIFYRHRPTVVDGTPCYAGRSDICVDGICRILVHGEFMGLDEDTNSVHSAAAAVPVASQPRDSLTYAYRVGEYGRCSVSCNGGMQYRTVECRVQDPVYPRVVDDSYCITKHLQRPVSQQACNMHPCRAEYSASSFSVCSVTCGEGQQRREVTCVGSGGERLADDACHGLTRPPSVQTCRRPACHTQISWHVTEYGMCSRSCGGGVRERRVDCFDADLNPYPEDRCGSTSRPIAVEMCNSQPCSEAQRVPSIQDPMGHGSTVRRYVPYVPGASQPQTNTAIGHRCAQSQYGCCPDGYTSASGPRNQGCSQDDCVRSRHGCCLDGVTPAQGFGRAGCPEYQTAHPAPPAPPAPPAHPAHPSTAVCSMPRDEGPCDTWKVRFFYDSATRKCTEFWYGSCHGNANNFMSLEACQRECGGATVRETSPAPRRGSTRRWSSHSGALRARA